MIVYITTNLINGKKYIGQDKNNNPKYLGSGKILKTAVRKYGRKNFEKEILAYAQNKKDLNELERYYISYYNAQKSDLFYNIVAGGEGGNTHDQTTKKKKVYQFDRIGNLIKEWSSASDAAKELNIKRAHINISCNTGGTCHNQFWSKTLSLEHTLNREHKFNRPIIQKTKNNEFVKEWSCMSELTHTLGINKGNIARCFRNKNATCRGFKWEHKNKNAL